MENCQVTQGIQEQEEKIWKNNKAEDIMSTVTLDTSVITLNVKGFNSPIKRHKVTRWRENKTQIMQQKTHFSSKETLRLNGNDGN